MQRSDSTKLEIPERVLSPLSRALSLSPSLPCTLARALRFYLRASSSSAPRASHSGTDDDDVDDDNVERVT
jgi:hypothetical protein